MNEITVGVCDDEVIMLEYLKRYLDQFCLRHNIRFQIEIFQEGKQFLKHFHDQQSDIVLLDIEMGQTDGFSIAQYLNKENCDCKIIFLTNHEEWVQKGYQYHAFRYVYKFQMEKQLEEALVAAVREIRENTGVWIKDRALWSHHVKYKTISYIESLGDEVCLHLNGKKMISRITLKELNNRLDERFFRCHNQYIVNFDHIIRWNRQSVILKNEIQIPIARSRKKEFLKAYEGFILYRE